MIPTDLFLDAPYNLICLPIVIFMGYFFWRLFRYRKSFQDSFAPETLIPRRRGIYFFKSLSLCVLWIFSTLAISQPKGNGHYPEEKLFARKNQPSSKDGGPAQAKLRLRPHEVILLVDASASMAVRDARNKLSRLEYAKDIADQIVSKLDGESAALYAFTSEPELLSPLTMDYIFVRLMLREISINEGGAPGTNIAAVISDVRDHYFKTPSPELKTVVLFSDGGDTAMEDLKGVQREQAVKSLQEIVANAQTLHLRLFTVGLGSLEGGEVPEVNYQGNPVHSALNEELLRALARRGRGEYYFANDRTATGIADAIIQEMGKDNPFLDEEAIIQAQAISAGGGENIVYDLYYQIPLAAVILLLGWVLVWPDLRLKRWTMSALAWPIALMLSETVDALNVDEEMRQAEIFFEAGDYRRALDIYENLQQRSLPLWQSSFIAYDIGTVAIAEGNYSEAIDQLHTVSLDVSPENLLASRIKTNLAAAYYLEAEGQQFRTVDDFDKGLFLLRQSLRETALARKMDDLLTKSEGGSVRPEPLDLTLLERAAKGIMAEILQNRKKFILSEAAFREGLLYHLKMSKEMEEHIEVLQGKILNDNVIKQYVDLIARQAGEWSPYWPALLQKMKKEKLTALEAPFRQASAYFTQGVDLLKKNDIPGAAKAIKTMDSLLGSVAERYQDMTGEFLGKEQREKQQITALEILKNSLYAQLDAMEQNRNWREAKEDGTFIPVLHKAQEQVLRIAEPFLNAVYLQQMAVFTSTDADKIQERCQYQPWNEVIPLFEGGLAAASQAINEGRPSLRLQEKASGLWRRALEEMKHPTPRFSGSCSKQGGTAGGQGGQKKSQEENKNEEQPLPLSDVIRSLEKMNLFDKPEGTTQTVSIPGVKPW